jgi:hypothetical protein
MRLAHPPFFFFKNIFFIIFPPNRKKCVKNPPPPIFGRIFSFLYGRISPGAKKFKMLKLLDKLTISMPHLSVVKDDSIRSVKIIFSRAKIRNKNFNLLWRQFESI